jgi:hypothetical protein
MHLFFSIIYTVVILYAIFVSVVSLISIFGRKKVSAPTPIPEPIKMVFFPSCVICGKEWAHLPGNTGIKWCSNNHDTIWFYQEENGVCSFDREVNDLYGEDYLISWNCQCSDEECLGKNIIYQYQYQDKDYRRPIKYVEPVDLFMLPLNISRERLYRFIGQS